MTRTSERCETSLATQFETTVNTEARGRRLARLRWGLSIGVAVSLVVGIQVTIADDEPPALLNVSGEAVVDGTKQEQPEALLIAVTPEVVRPMEPEEVPPMVTSTVQSLPGHPVPQSARTLDPRPNPYAPGTKSGFDPQPQPLPPAAAPVARYPNSEYPGPPTPVPQTLPVPYRQYQPSRLPQSIIPRALQPQTQRLQHLRTALTALRAAGLKKEAASVEREIAAEELQTAQRLLSNARSEVARLQQTVDQLKKVVAQNSPSQNTAYLLKTLALKLPAGELRKLGILEADKFGKQIPAQLSTWNSRDTKLDLIRKLADSGGKGIKLLAKPHMIVVDGSAASFLSGGEIPVTKVVQVKGTDEPVTSIEWRDFGLNVSTTVTRITDDRIHLELSGTWSHREEVQAAIDANTPIPDVSKTKNSTSIEMSLKETAALITLLKDGSYLLIMVSPSIAEPIQKFRF